MQRSDSVPKTPLSRSSTGKLGTPGRLASHTHSASEDFHVNVKQLIAPVPESFRERKVFVNECDKPDVHLRSDQSKPKIGMIRIQSAARLKAEKAPNLDIDDESKQPIELFQFEEMVRIGRPDRDNTLRVPLMRNLQTLRKYKMGTAPSTKTGILQNTLEDVVQDPLAKQVVASLSTGGHPASFDGAGSATLAATRATMSTPQLSTSKPRSSPFGNNRTQSPSGQRERIVVRTAPNMNMNALHLSREGKRTVNKTQSEKTLPRFDLQADSIDSVALAMPPEEEEVVGQATEQPDVAMYDPATVRLPRMESVPGFGNTNPMLDRALGAYRVHSNRAVTAAAALEEASLSEDIDSQVGRDSFHPDRVESFYKSAETSHINSQDGENSVDSQDVSIREISVKTAPQEVPLRRGLHCTKCFRAAGLWCSRCTAAFCSVCWGQVVHHDLRQMTAPPSDRPRTVPSQPPSPLLRSYQEKQMLLQHQRGNFSPSSEGARSPGQSPSGKHTYAKSVMFQSYHSNRPSSSGPNAKCRQTAAAKIPLPDQVVIKYDEYPAPPVFLDGRGRVVEDTFNRRPVTSPVTTQEELHRLQMSNHFKKQTAHEQYQQMLALKYKSHTVGAPAPSTPSKRTSSGGSPHRSVASASTANESAIGVTSDPRESLGVINGIVYAQPKPKPVPHSKGRVVVRKNRKKDSKQRPSSPSFGLNANGTLSLGYGGKPRAGAKQLTNISSDLTKNISPDDWKTQLFAGNDVPFSVHKIAGPKDISISSPFYKVKPL